MLFLHHLCTLIDEYGTKNNLVYMKCFRFTVYVCRWYFGFIAVVKLFCFFIVAELFLFYEPVTICHIIKIKVHMLWCCEYEGLCERKGYISKIFLTPRMKHNQAEMQHADWKKESLLSLHAVFLSAGAFLSLLSIILGKWALQQLTLGNILLPVPWTALPIIPLLRNAQHNPILLSLATVFIRLIYPAFIWPMNQLICGVKNRSKDNVVRFYNECQCWVWKEPTMGDKSLSCAAVLATCGWMCDSPRPCALLTTCTVRLLPHTGL